MRYNAENKQGTIEYLIALQSQLRTDIKKNPKKAGLKGRLAEVNDEIACLKNRTQQIRSRQNNFEMEREPIRRYNTHLSTAFSVGLPLMLTTDSVGLVPAIGLAVGAVFLILMNHVLISVDDFQ